MSHKVRYFVLLGVGPLAPALKESIDHRHHVAQSRFLRKPLSVIDAQDLHPLMVLEVRKQFWRDEEILRALRITCHLYHIVMHCPLRTLIHTLHTHVKKCTRVKNILT